MKRFLLILLCFSLLFSHAGWLVAEEAVEIGENQNEVNPENVEELPVIVVEPDTPTVEPLPPAVDPDPLLPQDAPLPEPEAEPLPELPTSPLPEKNLFINEILADPAGDDASGEFIELYNAGLASVDLTGYRVDDARTEDGSYIFSSGIIEAQSFLVLFRSETKIVLNNDQDTVTLFNSLGNEVDSFAYGPQVSDRSVGRNPENLSEWISFKDLTPGMENPSIPNGVPVAVIDIQKDTRYMKLNVTGENSSDPDGDILNFLWEFDTGVSDTRSNPLIYEYLTPGPKLVRLTVTDSRGASGQTEITFDAIQKEALNIGDELTSVDSENHAPLAVIEIQKDTRYMKLNVTGENSTDPDGDSLTFFWEFESGATDTRSNPLIYEYGTSGSKRVRLTVMDSRGASALTEIIFLAEPKISGSASVTEYYPTYQLINEILPDPAGKDDENEWMELYNGNDFGIDLSGWYLDDAEKKSSPFKIPEGTVIFPHGYLLFSAPDLKLSFNNMADTVRLLDPSKNVNEQIDYAGVKENGSYARREDGTFEWTSSLTPSAANIFPSLSKRFQPKDIVFESVLPNPDGKDTEGEKIKLKNQTSEDIQFLGWTILDATGHEKPLPDIIIPAGQIVELYATDLGLSLNNTNEQLSLFDPFSTLIDEINWKHSVSGRWFLNPDSLGNELTGRVLHVFDGDTFLLEAGEKRLTVRLLGIDTPETVHPYKPVEYFGKQASEFLTKELSGQTVRLEFDENKIDKYGRVLAYVFLSDKMMNREILAQGFAYVYTRFPFRYRDEFVDLEKTARDSKVGLWENQKIVHFMDQLIQEQLSKEEEVAPDLLPVLEEPVIPEELKKVEEIPATVIPSCSSDFLKIDAVLPNPQKGQAVEYIRLINQGSELTCLQNWILDDVLEKGSRPFAIKGGAIAPGGVRTFRKNETSLALNNFNDCVNLIEPGGRLADQICYQKTHKNEIFTHAGGDWKPKPKVKAVVQRKASNKTRFRFSRDLISYKSGLSTIKYIGKINFVDEKNKVLVMTLEGQQKAIISFTNSSIDMLSVRSLINLDDRVQVQVLNSPSKKELVSIESFAKPFPQAIHEDSGSAGVTLFAIISAMIFVLLGAKMYIRHASH